MFSYWVLLFLISRNFKKKAKAAKKAAPAKAEVQPKYWLPHSGETWSGRGRPPRAFTAWEGTAKDMKAAAEALDKAAGKAEGAASQLGWRIFVVTSMGFLLFMLVLLIGLWLWLTPELMTTKEGAVWLLLRLK